jgi:hypothetical protein
VLEDLGLVVHAVPGHVQDLGQEQLDQPVVADHLQRDAAALLGRGLAIALDGMKPLDATHVASSWAVSPDPMRRIGIARALEWSFPLVGDGLVIEHLSHDPDPQVRAACARAAWIRRATGGDLGVLDRLARDPEPEVAAIALWPR